MKKRLLSLFLALVMLVSLIPTTAFASTVDDGHVQITAVDVNEDRITVTMNMATKADSSLVFAGYSESGKLLASQVYRMEPLQEYGVDADFPCEDLSEVGNLATVKVFVLGPDNRLLGMPYETQAFSSNPTKDGGTWEYRWGEYLDWAYDNGTLTVTSQRRGYPGIIPGSGELAENNPHPWEKYKDRVTTLNLVNIGYVGGYVFSEYPALETVRSDVALHVEIEGFSKCPNLKTVDALIDTLGPSAFLECGSLEELDLRYAQSIGQYALSGTAIRQVILLNSQVELHGGAFQGMNNLVYVSLCTPGIPASLMRDQHSLQVVAGLEEVGFIGEEAFKGSGINAYHSSAGSVQIEAEAFAQCANLRTVNIPGNSTLEKRAFAQANIASLTLNAQTIPEEAFTLDGSTDEFVEMAYVELIGTESIANKAFWRRSIGDLYIPATLTDLTHDAFGNTEIRVLHLPEGWNLTNLEDKVDQKQLGWEWLLNAETILDSEGNVLKGETEGDGGDIGGDEGGDIAFSEETTETTVPETTPETTPATVTETTPETTSPTEAPAPETEAPETEEPTTEEPTTEDPINPENFDTVYVAPEGASMEEIYTADGVAVFSGKDTASGDKHTVKFTGLMPQSAEPYVLIVSSAPGNLESLQYIDYGYADAKGQLTMTYIPKQSGNYTVQLYGPAGSADNVSLSQDYVTLEVGQTFLLKVLNSEDYHIFWGAVNENQDIATMQGADSRGAVLAITANNPGITQFAVKVYQYSTGFEKEMTCTVEVVNQPSVLEAHLMDTKATKELFSNSDNPTVYISLTKENQPVRYSEDGVDTQSAETTIIKSARFKNEELNNYFKLRPVNDRTLEIVSYLPSDISQVKTSYVSAIEVLAGENEDYLTTPETLKLTVKKTMPKVTAKTVTINAWNPGVVVPVQFNLNAKVVNVSPADTEKLEQVGIRDTMNSGDLSGTLLLDTTNMPTDTKKQTLKVNVDVQVDGWIIRQTVPLTINIVNTPITAKLSASKITLSSVNSKGTDLQLVAPKGYALQDLGIRAVTVDGNDYTLGDFDPSTGSFHLTPVIQEGADYRNPVTGKINILVTYANGVTDELPLTVTTKAPTIKPKKTSFSFSNGVTDVQSAAFTVSPADYDLSVFDMDDEDCPLMTGVIVPDPEDPEKPDKFVAFAQAMLVPGTDSEAEDFLGAGIDALGVIGYSNGYVGTVKLTFDRIPGVKPITVTVKFTKNTPTMTLKVNGTIDASKTNKVTLTTTVKNMNVDMVFDAEVTLLDPHGNVVDPSEYVVDVPSSDRPDTLLLYRRPEMSGQLEDGTYTVQVTRNVYDVAENPIPLTASAKLKVKNTTPTLKASKTKVTLNPYDGKDVEIKLTFPKDQYTENSAYGWMDAEGNYLNNGQQAPPVRWIDENTITVNTYDPYTGKLIDIPDGVYYLCMTPNYLDSDAKTVTVPVTVQRKALKSVKTWKDGPGINLLNWDSYQDQGIFLPMTEQAYESADCTVTLQGSNDNKTFVDIDQTVFPNPKAYYPICAEDEKNYFQAGKYDWGTLKEDCAYFGMYAFAYAKDPYWEYERENWDIYRYYRAQLTVTAEDGGTVYAQTIKLPVKNTALKVTQSKVPTVDRRDFTKPFTAQVKFSEKSVTLFAKIPDDAFVNGNTKWNTLVRVTNLDSAGNLTLAFQDAAIAAEVGKSVTIPVTFYLPYGREDQTFTANIKVNFK